MRASVWSFSYLCYTNERKSEEAHNIASECCIQRMAIPSISDGQLDRKPVSSELNKNNFGQSLKGILIAP